MPKKLVLLVFVFATVISVSVYFVYKESVYGRNGSYIFRVSDKKIPIKLGVDKSIEIPSEYFNFSISKNEIFPFLKKAEVVNRKRTTAGILIIYPDFKPIPIKAKTGLMYSDDVIAINIGRRSQGSGFSNEQRLKHFKEFLFKKNEEGEFFYYQNPEAINDNILKYNSDLDIIPKNYPNTLYAVYDKDVFRYFLSCEEDYGYEYTLCNAGQWAANDYTNYTLYVREKHVGDMDSIHEGVKEKIGSFVP